MKNSKVYITSLQTYNPKKQYLIKQYTNGDYYVNQSVDGKLFYKWVKISACDAHELSDTHPRQLTLSTCNKFNVTGRPKAL